MTDRDDYLPLSMLNQYVYCPRRFWLMYVEGEMLVNAAVLEGTLQHRRVHRAGHSEAEGQETYRRLYIWSDRLQVVGFADLVEDQAGAWVPVEYKRGKKGRWINDHVQLCAQAVCLEERTGTTIPEGEIFYWRSRRRVRVPLDTALRNRTEEVVAAIHACLDAGRPPRPDQPYAKCRQCSLEPVCMPRELRRLMDPPRRSR
jgi:CRISPR-associated exonuclease Cas4